MNKGISRRVKAARRPKPPKDGRTDLLADLIKLHNNKPDFTDVYLRKMAMTNFGAGHETMASTLTSVLAMIGSQPELQQRVVTEVLNTADPSSYANAIRLPITQAAIKESRRLHPVISMSLPRTVPSTGLHLHGHFFPSGTTVGCSPVALHRNPDIFGVDPDHFSLERWLDADMDTLRNMERYNLGWGGGSRTCPGKHLAEVVVYKIVPALIREFRIEVDLPEKKDLKSYFLSIMMGVKVRFVERSSA